MRSTGLNLRADAVRIVHTAFILKLTLTMCGRKRRLERRSPSPRRRACLLRDVCSGKRRANVGGAGDRRGNRDLNHS